MEDDIKLPDNVEAEFDPLVVIVADERARYESFAAHLIKNGFKCELYEEIPEALLESPVPGTIYFVSFNLKTADASLLARRIEQKNNLCIVFAEQQGIETAAKLSSAKLTQTLQHPYTEKNFTMAVQTIVKKRRVQYEKAIRKQSVLERRKGMTDPMGQVEATGTQIFKADVKTESGLTPLIFEERVRGKKYEAVIEGHPFLSGHSHFTHDRRRRGLMEIQKGLTGATFVVMPTSKGPGRTQVHMSGAGPVGNVVQTEGPQSSLGSTTQTGSSAGGSGAVRMQDAPVEKASSVSRAGAVKGAAHSNVQTGPDAKSMSIATETRKSSDGIAYMPTPDADKELTHPNSQSPKDAASKNAGGAAPKEQTAHADQLQRAASRDGLVNEDEAAKARVKRDGETLVGYSKDDLRAAKSVAPPAEETALEEEKEASALTEPERQVEVTKIAGTLAVPTWALIAAASIGILFILFFLYQMIFQRH